MSRLDFFYCREAEQFTFYRIPKQLLSDARFRRISTDAKLLYGLMLDRMGLSLLNKWVDDLGRVYIFYTVKDAEEQLCCSPGKAVKLFAELEPAPKGVGLIERVKQGQGRPAIIYPKNFTTDLPDNPDFQKLEVTGRQRTPSRKNVAQTGIGVFSFQKNKRLTKQGFGHWQNIALVSLCISPVSLTFFDSLRLPKIGSQDFQKTEV